MYTILLLAGIGLIIGLIAGARSWDPAPFLGSLAGAFIGIVVGIVLATIIGYSQIGYSWHGPYSAKLVNAKQFEGVSGHSYFLGSGYIGSDLCYSFYYEQDNAKVPSYVCLSRAVVKVIEEERKDAELVWLDYDRRGADSKWLLKTRSFKSEYVFHVPKGSVQEGYNFG